MLAFYFIMNFLDSINPIININSILAQYSEESLYKMYCSDFPKSLCSSPFRTDKTPSFSFYHRSHWYWKDLKTMEGGGIFQFIQKCENTKDLSDTLKRLQERFNLNTTMGAITKASHTNNNESNQKLMQYVIRNEFTIFEIATWLKWNIAIGYLLSFNVGSANQVFLNRELIWQATNTNPIFYYHFIKTNNVKAYRPLESDKRRKHMGRVDGMKDIFGLHQLFIQKRKFKIIVITKAMKEILFFKSFGITAIALCGEGYYFPKNIITEVLAKADYVITFYDADPAGWHGAWQLRKAYNIPAFFLPKSMKCKNITDLWEIDYKKCYEVIQMIFDWPLKNKEISTQYKNKII